MNRRVLILAALAAAPFLVGASCPGARSCLGLPTKAAIEQCLADEALGDAVATPAPHPSVTAATPEPAATATTTPAPAPFVQLPPKLDMTTSGEASSGIVEITQHYLAAPELLHPLVREEVPTLDAGTEFWRNRFEGIQRARNCDTDHYFFNDGSKSPMWWICGGSEKYHVEPRNWDLVDADQVAADNAQPFQVTCTGVGYTYPRPGPSGYYRIAVGPGPGSCTVCAPKGATTPDGIPLRVHVACGTWPVK